MNINLLKRSIAALILVLSGPAVLNAQTDAAAPVSGNPPATNAVTSEPAAPAAPAAVENAPAAAPVPAETKAAVPETPTMMDNPLVITNAMKTVPDYRPLSVAL